MKSTHSFCTLAITTALALAIPAVYAADAPTLPATKVSAITQTNQSYNRFIVTYRDGSSERSNRNAVMQNVQSAVSRMGLDRATRSSTGAAIAPLTVSYQRKLAVGADLVRTSRKLSANEATTLMQQIATDPAVLHVEPDVMMRAVRDFRAPTTMKPSELISGAPNDPYYAQYQWDYNNPTGGANIEQAWSLADGTGITVAVLDTGITEHPDLDTSLADDGYDFISDSFVSGRDTDDRTPGGWDLGDWTTTEPWLSECTDAQNPPEDSSWHGTHVSGTVGEMTDNGVGMAGVAHNAKVLPIRVLGHCGGYNSDIADAIVWASGGHVDGVPDNQHPAQVINMSLGGGGVCLASDVTGTAIASALSRGTTVVVAAGNSGSDAGLFSPASCPGVIAVGSNGITGKRAFYSNYGATVSIAAPGGGIYPNDGSTGTPTNDGFIWSSLNDGETTPDNPVYGGMAGTSQATPHVAGAVALILSAQQQAGLPVSTPAKLRQLIMSTARPFPVPVDQPLG
ncbi:MAG: S8 family serine peptidase, partial [Rhodanobacter sp.]